MRLIGIDIGTTTISAVVLDEGSGALAEAVTIPNRGTLPSAHPWEREQDPTVILEDALALFERLSSQYAPIASVGVTGQMHGIVYLDAEGHTVSPLITWQDGRGDRLCGTETYAARLSRLTGYTVATGYGAVTHYVMTEQNTVPEGAVTFCTIHDLLAMRLTGRTVPLLHASDAASLGLFDLETGDFDRTAIERAGMDPRFFPAVARAAQPIGTLPGGQPVMPAIGDNQASFIGSVRDMAGSVLVNMGTGSQISCKTDRRIRVSGTETRPLLAGDYLWVGSALCGGRAYAALERFFLSAAQGLGAETDERAVYRWMDALSAQVFELPDPLTVSTTFSGTRENPALRGGIHGLSVDNFTPVHLICGVLQGTVRELFRMYEDALPQLGQKPVFLVGSGNGLRKSAVWRELFSRAFALPLAVPAHKEEAAYGAALFGLTGCGLSLQEAQRLIRYLDE